MSADSCNGRHPEDDDGDWLVDTGYACGWVRVDHGVIIRNAPIFWKWRGQRMIDILERYKATRLEVPDEKEN